MPIYEFKCKECKEEFSLSGSFSSFYGFEPKCPHCKSKNVNKKFSVFGIVFNGEGFYKTDNR